uniref:Ribosomal protein L11 methyltransferase (PrmA) n=1 Tax=Candidatus Kentrum sp. TC TaxID=2126339 RepID=A0A450Z2A5_9GAMM|nr:MAG: Ribosomal protein L11 methyltransferase (PrmA) [Candidatus Kentron sp. TC]VFK59473.1 MAG: Ribosomal protein L11 methyltransferase (PrmA) [Candidatus Kentron sp. TC]
MDMKKYDICGHEVALLSQPDVWSPHSAVEMTTYLVEAGYLRGLENRRVLDMGTGSGVIGILCGLLGAKSVTLSDLSSFFGGAGVEER